MPTVSWEPTALNSTYDSDEIQFSSGAQFKNRSEWADLLAYYRFLDNLNDSKASSNLTGTDLSTYSTLTGIPGKTLDFNGTSSKALFPALMTSGLSEFTLSIWCRPDDLSSGRCLWENGNDGVYWLIVFNRSGTNARLVSSYVNHDSSPAFVETSLGGSDGLAGEVVHIYLTAKEGGNAYFYVNGVLIGVRACGNFLTVGNNHYIGCTRGGATQFFDGLIANPAIWEKQYDITGEHCRSIYEAEREIYQYELSSTVYPSTALAPSENVRYTSYTVTETGGGSTAHRLSPDDGTTNFAYAGGVWGVSDTGNAESTVNTYIDEYTQGYSAITPVVTLVSDGFTQHTVSNVEIGFTSNNAPTVDAGLDKPLSGHCQITTETAFKPFVDCIIVDEDPGIYTVASVDYRIDSGSWVSIPKGSFTTFQDAARALSIAAGTLAVGSYTFSLRTTDGGTPALSTTDTLTVTVVSPVSAIWEVQTSSLSASGSIGKLLTDMIDAAISSRSSQVSVDAIPTSPLLSTDPRLDNLDASISTVDSVVDGLAVSLALIPTNPVLDTDSRLDHLDADISDLATAASLSAVDTKIDAIPVNTLLSTDPRLGYLDASISTVDSVVDGISLVVSSIPTDTLLSTDARLDYLDGSIASKASQASVTSMSSDVTSIKNTVDAIPDYSDDISKLAGGLLINSTITPTYTDGKVTGSIIIQYTDSTLTTELRRWVTSTEYTEISGSQKILTHSKIEG